MGFGIGERTIITAGPRDKSTIHLKFTKQESERWSANVWRMTNGGHIYCMCVFKHMIFRMLTFRM